MENQIHKEKMLPVGTVLHGVYRVESCLGEDVWAITYRVVHVETKIEYVIKEFFCELLERGEHNFVDFSYTKYVPAITEVFENFKKEAEKFKSLNHEHLANVVDVFDENGTSYYVIEKAEGKSLREIVKATGKPLSEVKAMNYFMQVLDVLEYFHERDVFHLGINPGNFLVDENDQVKIIGFSAWKLEPDSFNMDGPIWPGPNSYGYRPIELTAHNKKPIGPYSDLCSLGATLYFMLTAEQPPESTEILCEGEEVFTKLCQLSPRAKSIVLWMTMPSYKRRPQNVADLRAAMEGCTPNDLIKLPEYVTAPAKPVSTNASKSGMSCGLKFIFLIFFVALIVGVCFLLF